jgi:hypothetical protein
MSKAGKTTGLYNKRRYWYHISTTLGKKHEYLIPWGEKKGVNRSGDEPDGERVCVAPTIEQCLTALPYYLGTVCTVYRTKSPLKVAKAKGVFDSRITHEGWIQRPTAFVKVGILRFEDVEKALGVENVVEEAASYGDLDRSRKVLRWWRMARLRRFIKRA